jgi:hypothetical protein
MISRFLAAVAEHEIAERGRRLDCCLGHRASARASLRQLLAPLLWETSGAAVDARRARFNIDDVINNDVKVRVEGGDDASGYTRRDTELSPHYKRAFIRFAFSRH